LASPFFAYTEDGLLRRRMEESGIPVFHLPMPSRYNLRAARAVAALCRERRIDVIHTHFLRENYIALLSRLFRRGTRVVYTNHLFFPVGLVTRLSNRILSRLQHAVIAVCNPAKDQMIRNGVPGRRIHVVHNGVEAWERSDGRKVRVEAGVPDGVPVILCAARMVEDKGHQCLLTALASLTDIPFRLLLAFDGPLRGALEEEAKRLALPVTFLGFREDMPEVLSAADICVNAAGTEACSYNILEAMAMGIPQVVADAGGNADLIDGANGLLFRHGDPADIARALRTMLSDGALRDRCARKAAETARSRFSEREMLEKTISIYQREM
jgi:glycosyltransferase involved in cell wall biosynthesis